MTYLIAHIVRGEPAFDIAIKFRCPICEGARQGLDNGNDHAGNCTEDDWWWIIPTSGHRAYPYWWCEMYKFGYVMKPDGSVPNLIPPADYSLPDHYTTHATPGTGRTDLLSLIPLKPVEPIKRRV